MSETTADLPEPKFQLGDRVKVLYPWAGGRIATITDGAMWDEPWECYTYVVDNGVIRLEEHELEMVERRGWDVAELTPDWLAELRENLKLARISPFEALEHLPVLLDHIDAQAEGIERLRAEVREWMCDECDTVYPGPPQVGVWSPQCPRCGGWSAPKSSVMLRRARLDIERLRRDRDSVVNIAAAALDHVRKRYNGYSDSFGDIEEALLNAGFTMDDLDAIPGLGQTREDVLALLSDKGGGGE